MAQKRIPLKERFNNWTIPEPNSGCLLWIGAYTNSGYGRIQISPKGEKQKANLAHRVAYKFFKGEIPPKMVVMHICDNKICVNPNHLILGTHRDNTLDGIKKGRINKLKINANELFKIIELINKGARRIDILKMYNISRSTFNKIKYKKGKYRG